MFLQKLMLFKNPLFMLVEADKVEVQVLYTVFIKQVRLLK
jgi:hypothetical protein